jgi:hypothetical protein
VPWDLQLLEKSVNADKVSFMETLMIQDFHQSTQHQTVTIVGGKQLFERSSSTLMLKGQGG